MSRGTRSRRVPPYDNSKIFKKLCVGMSAPGKRPTLMRVRKSPQSGIVSAPVSPPACRGGRSVVSERTHERGTHPSRVSP